MTDVDPLVTEFCAETWENLARVEVDLVAMEQEPDSSESIARVFRMLHTVKGTCGFLGFTRLEALGHAGETLLSEWREGRIADPAGAVDVLLHVIDRLRELLRVIERDGSDAAVDERSVQDTARRVEAFLVGQRAGQNGSAAPVVAPREAAFLRATEEQPDDDHTLDDALHARDESVRVSVEVLDALMRQVGELLLARNRLAQYAAEQRDPVLTRLTASVRGTVAELQNSVMLTRLQPISTAWAQVPRLVRDLGAELSKELRLDVEGGETEIDRALIAVLRDPLTHIVRNAADHGIEDADERRAAGKPAAGAIALHAYARGGRLVVDVTDDGRGVDLAAVVARAVSLGLVTEAQRDELDEAACLDLLFSPGFSTARTVTNLSGRGVGMDVVRTQVESIGGTVTLINRPGEGTTVRLSLPVSLAITPAVVVDVAGQRFGIAQTNVAELIRTDATNRIESLSGAPVLRVRGDVLPLVDLHDSLGIPAAGATDPTVVVVSSATRSFGLVVDAVLGTEELVVEPIDPRFASEKVWAGAAILGDGAVALMIDPRTLAERASIVVEEQQSSTVVFVADEADGRQLTRLVVATVGGGRRVALPVDAVARLEQLPVDGLAVAGGRRVLPYRGALMPFVDLGCYLSSDGIVSAPTDAVAAERVPALVFHNDDRWVALAVDEIEDIVDTAVEMTITSDDARVVGSALLGDRPVDLLDVEAALLSADPQFFAATGDDATLVGAR